MGELPLQEELSLRILAPNVYNKMLEVFSDYHLHPYDAEASVVQNKDEYMVKIRLAGSRATLGEKTIRTSQVENPDADVVAFFQNAAEECKNLMIKNCFNMTKG